MPCSTSPTSVFATREQELLLQAALLDGLQAQRAFLRWYDRVDFEGEMDNGSFRLLPLLFHNLKSQSIDHPVMHRLKGIYRHAWYKNHTLFYELRNILQCIRNAGIATMVIKGAALTVQVYRNYAIRPMADVDILVPRDRVTQAWQLLKQQGWTPVTERAFEDDLKFRHSINFMNTAGFEFDLHWHPVKDSSITAQQGAYDGLFWESTESIRISDEPTLAPGLPESLFLVLLHGSWKNVEPSIRWIADATYLIRAMQDNEEWSRFIKLVRYYHVPLQIKRALGYLQAVLGVAIPAGSRRTLDQIKVTLLERLTYESYLRHDRAKPGYAIASRIPGLIEYLRVSGNRNMVQLMAGFPEYVKYRMKNRRLDEVLAYCIGATSSRRKCPPQTETNPGRAAAS